MLELLQSSLQELRVLLVSMEQGNNLLCRTVSTTLRRVLVDELPIAARGYDLYIRSYCDTRNEFRTSHPLTTLEITSHGTRIAPVILHQKDYVALKLQKWRNQKVFFGKEASDFFQARDISRFETDLSRDQVINYTRHEVGAHVDKEISAFYKFSSSEYTMFDMRVTDDRNAPTSGEKLKPPHKWNYLSATIAAIATEFLLSVEVVKYEGKLLLVNREERKI